MKPARIVVICVAAISAIGLALVVRTMGSSSGQPTTPAAAESPAQPTEPMAKVLVAAKDLEAGSRLTAADMVWKDWAVSAVDAT
ncbi:MAG: Flp pilus assembly protein CpaB, partial [Alphaproteobacteria bacterium]|nr:Flp pilus assembly protein CpaB [Alphaproteobacteria bacterium]